MDLARGTVGSGAWTVSAAAAFCHAAGPAPSAGEGRKRIEMKMNRLLRRRRGAKECGARGMEKGPGQMAGPFSPRRPRSDPRLSPASYFP